MAKHIGKLILSRLAELGMNKSEFARRINKSRQNVQDIFKRESVDTDLLLQISKVLNFNFFTLLAANEELAKAEVHEDGVMYKKKQKGDKVNGGSEDIKKQLDIARREISYLEKINTLLENKIGKKSAKPALKVSAKKTAKKVRK
ncbi:helix-turn-helix transcriptional regulator [Sporocytophaga myxococcoides]|uniref:helix-turn-helix transcriptional regulator n=1 Tax=Sporocytophaga myxococcoides TaxID=153721 RepID=UPI000688702B|nr:helix-turn-helix domain-containing protein [Sporocytophaga myxococcoides]